MELPAAVGEAAGADEADNDPAVVARSAAVVPAVEVAGPRFAGSGVAPLVEGSGVAVVDDSEAPAGADDTCWVCVGVSVDVT